MTNIQEDRFHRVHGLVKHIGLHFYKLVRSSGTKKNVKLHKSLLIFYTLFKKIDGTEESAFGPEILF